MPAHKPKTFNPKPVEGAVTPLIDIYGGPDSSGVIVNHGSATADGNVSGELSFISKGGLINYRSSGTDVSTGVINCGSDASLDDLNNMTFIVDDFEAYSPGPSSAGRIFDKRFYVSQRAGALRVVGQFTDGFAVWEYNDLDPFSHGQLTITWDISSGSNNPRVYFNGAECAVTVVTPKTGTPISNAADDLLLCNSSALNRSGDFTFSRFRMFGSILTSDQRDELYEEYSAKRVIRYTNRFEFPPVSGSITPPGHAGPWRTIGTNTNQYLDDGTYRYLYHDDIDAVAYQDCNHAYGAWYVRYEFEYFASFRANILALGQNAETGYAGAQTGYSLYHNHKFGKKLQLHKVTSGAVVTVADGASSWVSDATQIIELFMVRRRTDGQFTFYSRDNNHSTWTQVAQGTDNTHTTCNYIVNDTKYDAGSKMSILEVMSWPYGDTLHPNDVPELKDL